METRVDLGTTRTFPLRGRMKRLADNRVPHRPVPDVDGIGRIVGMMRAARSARSLPPCGGGLGGGFKRDSRMTRPPPCPSHKGGGNAAALHRFADTAPLR